MQHATLPQSNLKWETTMIRNFVALAILLMIIVRVSQAEEDEPLAPSAQV